nr:immunoglobulin heavy chain junction region [Macaca mulatta]MOW48820.1 immunoglobulin heavy chain junction region [Macaca mulatta]
CAAYGYLGTVAAGPIVFHDYW